MSEGTVHLAESIGKNLSEDVGSRLVYRAAKTAAFVARGIPPHEHGFDLVDLDNPLLAGDGYDTKLLASNRYTQSPDLLAFGVLPQVGTYLQGKKLIGEGALGNSIAFAADMIFDPLNLASFGTLGVSEKLTKGVVSGLTKSGQLARLISGVSEGGRLARTGAEVIDRVHETLKFASILSNESEAIITAAKAGDDKALASIIGKALATGEVAKADAPILAAMQKDRKALGALLQDSERFANLGELPSEAFLQSTTKGRLAAKQINPLLRITKPANPLTAPGAFVKNMMGFHGKGDTYWLSIGETAAAGLDAIGVGAIKAQPAREAAVDTLKKALEDLAQTSKLRPAVEGAEEEAKLLTNINRNELLTAEGALKPEVEAAISKASTLRQGESAALNEVRSRIAAAKDTIGELASAGGLQPPARGLDILASADNFRPSGKLGVNAQNAVVGLGLARVMTAIPQDQLIKDMGYGAITEKELAERYRNFRLPPLSAETDVIGTEGFEQFKAREIKRLNGIQMSNDQFLVRKANATIQEASDVASSALLTSVDEAIHAGVIDQAYGEQISSMLRRIHDEFGIRALVRDIAEPGFGLPGRQSFGTLMAHATVTSGRSLLEQGYTGKLAREYMSEVLGPAIAYPDLFELKGDRLHLIADQATIEARSPFLAASLKRSRASPASSFLEKHLRDEGMDAGFSFFVGEGARTVKAMGETALNEGIIQGIAKDYFPRVFHGGPKFFSEFGGDVNNVQTALETLFASDKGDEILARLMSGQGYKVMLDKAAQGKITHAEMRRWTEELAVKMEEAGYGEYEKDSLAILGGYVESSVAGLMVNRLMHDIPEIAGPLTYKQLASLIGTKAANKIPASALEGMSRAMWLDGPGDIPSSLRDEFVELDLRYRTEPGARNVEAMTEKAIAEEMGARRGANVDIENARRLETALGQAATARDTAEKALDDGLKSLRAGDLAAKKATEDADALLKAMHKELERVTKAGLKEIGGVEKGVEAVHAKYGRQAQAALSQADAALRKASELSRGADDVARLQTAKELAGKKQVFGMKLRMKGSSEPVEFLEEWVLTDSYPENLVGWKSVKAEVNRHVSSQEIQKRVGAAVLETRNSIIATSNKLRGVADEALASANKAVDAGEKAVAAAEKDYAKINARFKRPLERAEEAVKSAAERKLQRARAARDGFEAEAARQEQLANQASAMEARAAKDARINTRAGMTQAVADQKQLAANAAERKTARVGKRLFVLRADAAHLQEALHVYTKSGLPANGKIAEVVRKYRDWNYRFKSVKLLGDIFHYNTVAFNQILTDPQAVLKVLMSAEGLRSAAIGAGAGAALGAASGKDESGTAGMSLAGAVYALAIDAALRRSTATTRWALNPEHVDTLYWMARGGWTGRPDDRSIGILSRGLAKIRNDLARDGNQKFLINKIDGTRHLVDAWENNLWEVLHNGSKHFYFDNLWRKELPRLEASREFQHAVLGEQFAALRREGQLAPGMTTKGKFVLAKQDAMRADLARQIMQSANNLFGGQTWRHLVDHPEYVRVARDFLLAPDWTASRLALSSTMLMNTGPMMRAAVGAGAGAAVDYVQNGGHPEDLHIGRSAGLGALLSLGLGKWADGIARRMVTKGDVLAKEARRTAAAALLGGYTMANGLNYLFTGRFMWDNPPDRRTQIDLGDNTFVALGKPWMEAFEFAGIYKPTHYPSPLFSRLQSKSAPIPHAIVRIYTNTNDFGGPFITQDDSLLDMASKDLDFALELTSPILLQGPARLGATTLSGKFSKRQIAAGALRTAGFQTSTPAEPGKYDLDAALRAAGFGGP